MLLFGMPDLNKKGGIEVQYTLHVGGINTTVNIPFRNVLPCRPRAASRPVDNLYAAAMDSLHHLHGNVDVKKLNETAKVVIICDDYTRPTPCADLLPSLLNFLAENHVQKRNISFLIGAGFHREMTRDEKVKKFGREICEQYPIHHHDALCAEKLVCLGNTKDGLPIIVNKAAAEADFLIGVGVVEIHPWAGFAGGGKILCPGVAGKKTINHTHALPVLKNNVDIGVTDENPFWRNIHEIADAAGLDMIVNVVLDKDEHVCHIHAGQPVAAQRACIDAFRNQSELIFSEAADIVVTTADPKYQYWGQASISSFGAGRVVKPGGTRIILAACPEGFGDSKLETEFYYQSLRRTWPDLDEYWAEMQGDRYDNSRNACAVHRYLKLLQGSDVIMVSQGFPPDISPLGSLNIARDFDCAMQFALRKHSRQAKVIVYDYGGMLLPSIA